MLTRLDSMLLFRIPLIHWSIRVRFRIRLCTVDWLRRSQIGSRRRVRFRTLAWTVDLWRGLLTWSIWLWGVSLDSGLMAGMSSPEPLEQSVLNTLWVTQPGRGITEEISDWVPVAHPVPDITLDGRLMEGTTYLDHSVLGVSLDSGLMEGKSGLEPLEQSVLSTLTAQPEEGITEKLSDQVPVALPVPDITLDGRPMEGTTYLEHSALGVSLDSGLMVGCRVWNHSSSRFLVRCWSHNLLKYTWRRTCQSVQLWRRKWVTDIQIWTGSCRLDIMCCC